MEKAERMAMRGGDTEGGEECFHGERESKRRQHLSLLRSYLLATVAGITPRTQGEERGGHVQSKPEDGGRNGGGARRRR